jgi:hypothetical protein
MPQPYTRDHDDADTDRGSGTVDHDPPLLPYIGLSGGVGALVAAGSILPADPVSSTLLVVAIVTTAATWAMYRHYHVDTTHPQKP